MPVYISNLPLVILSLWNEYLFAFSVAFRLELNVALAQLIC